MYKGIRLIKRVVALFLVLLLSIESFGAVVSDNDGSAFITKAEFDSLKNDFQSQIDQYNISIDSKIDGAIASYLAGINIKREKVLQNLVENYADIYWRRKLDILGSFRDWTSTSNYTQTDNVWYEPHFDKRAVIRSDYYCIGTSLTRFYFPYAYTLRGVWNFSSATGPVYRNEYNRWNPAVVALLCDYDKNDEITVTPEASGNILQKFYSNNNYCNLNGMGGSPEYYTSASQGWKTLDNNDNSIITMGSTDTTFPWVENLGVSGTSMINVRLYGYWNNNTNWYTRYTINRNANQWPYINPQYIANLDDNRDVTSTSWVNPEQISGSLFSANGGHVYADYSVADDCGKEWWTSMLGDDNDLIANIYRKSNRIWAGSSYAVNTLYSDYFDISWEISHALMCGVKPWTLSGVDYFVEHETKVPVTLHLPFLERYPLKKITTGQFKYGETNLKWGSGIPLSTYISGNGSLEINFNYAVRRLPDTDPELENPQIKIDIKKTNFLSEIDDYYSGSINGGETVLLKDATSTGDGSAKIVIEDVKEGDAVWIRIAPHSTAGGSYAKMTNLVVKAFEE